MRDQLKVFFTALTFLTRIPCPSWLGHDPGYLARSAMYFPAVGVLVGAVGAAVYALFALGYSPFVAALFGIAATVIVTGAFHEDAFADVCDGFGGGTPERRREILRDSRVGSFGVVGLVLLIGAKVLLLGGLPVTRAPLAFVVAHALGRWSAVLLIARQPRVTDAASLAKPFAASVTPAPFLGATLFAVLASLLCGPATAGALLALSTLVCLAAGRFFRRWIGGISGDCLGAVAQVVETVCYAVIAQGAALEAGAGRLLAP